MNSKLCFHRDNILNPLSGNPQKLSNTLKLNYFGKLALKGLMVTSSKKVTSESIIF